MTKCERCGENVDPNKRAVYTGTFKGGIEAAWHVPCYYLAHLITEQQVWDSYEEEP